MTLIQALVVASCGTITYCELQWRAFAMNRVRRLADLHIAKADDLSASIADLDRIIADMKEATDAARAEVIMARRIRGV